MSSLPTNFTDSASGHTSAHNDTNTQVNINSRYTTQQTISHTTEGALAVDLSLGHSVYIQIRADITTLTFTNAIVGSNVYLFFEGETETDHIRYVNLSNIKITGDAEMPFDQSVAPDDILLVEFVVGTFTLNWSWQEPVSFKSTVPPLYTPNRISPASLYIHIDPEDALTWGKAQPLNTELWVSSNKMLPQQNTDALLLGDGFGKSWEVDGQTLNSHTMRDLTTERIKPSTWGALPIIEQAFQYEKDGSYDYGLTEPTGENSGLNIDPSDALYFDYNLNEYRAPQKYIKIGFSGNIVRFATAFVVESWMLANDYTQAVFVLNEPTGTKRPILQGRIQSGRLDWVAYTELIRIALASPVPVNEQVVHSYTLPAVGQWCAIIVEFLVDPLNAGYFKMWDLDTTGRLTPQADVGNGWGYIFDDYDLNNQCFPSVIAMNQQHADTPDGITENWDPVAGNFRRGRWRVFSLGLGTVVDTIDYADHLRNYLNFPKPRSSDV